MAAVLTSRFSAATRFSSPVKIGILEQAPPSCVDRSAIGVLRAGFTASFGPANQDAGDAHSGRLKSGPKVQPPSVALPEQLKRQTFVLFR